MDEPLITISKFYDSDHRNQKEITYLSCFLLVLVYIQVHFYTLVMKAYA